VRGSILRVGKQPLPSTVRCVRSVPSASLRLFARRTVRPAADDWTKMVRQMLRGHGGAALMPGQPVPQLPPKLWRLGAAFPVSVCARARPATTTMTKDDDDDDHAAANAIIAASAPASVAASACTRADSCRQHMCPFSSPPTSPTHHPSPGSAHARSNRPVAYPPLRHRCSPHPQSLSARSSSVRSGS
jgi:hypothetical protein